MVLPSRRQLDARLRQLILAPASQENTREKMAILFALDKMELEPRTRKQKEQSAARKQLLALWAQMEQLGQSEYEQRVKAAMLPQLETELNQLTAQIVKPNAPRLYQMLPGNSADEKAVAYYALGNGSQIAPNGVRDHSVCSKDHHILTHVIPFQNTITEGVGLCGCCTNATLHLQPIIWEAPEDIAVALSVPSLPLGLAIPISDMKWQPPCSGANHEVALVIPINADHHLHSMTPGIALCACGKRAAVNYLQPSWAKPEKVARRLGISRIPIEQAVSFTSITATMNGNSLHSSSGCHHNHDAWKYVLEHVGKGHDENHIVFTCTCGAFGRIDHGKYRRVSVIEKRLKASLSGALREPA